MIPLNTTMSARSDDGEEGAIAEVFLRLRPMNELERSKRSRNCVQIHETEDGKNAITVDSPQEGEFDFAFEKVFGEHDDIKSISDIVSSPLVERLIEGYNCALVLYGQSGSGKTSTLIGRQTLESSHYRGEDEQDALSSDDGLISQVATEIFQSMRESSTNVEYIVKISYLEIYLEQIRDLLLPSNRFLNIREEHASDQSRINEGTGPKIEGLSEVCCVSASDIVALVKRGHAYRVISEERKGTDLFRSHCVLSINITQRDLESNAIIQSVLRIVDTAGSEMDDFRSNKRDQLTAPHSRQLERSLSGRSHSVLRDVVNTLDSDESSLNRSVAFRGSKLTSILKDALGGNSFCTFILTASPASFNINSTLATLRFGQRLKRITNFPTVRVQSSSMEYRDELEASKKILAKICRLVEQIEMRKNEGDQHIDDILQSMTDIISNDGQHMMKTLLENQEHLDLPLEQKLKLESDKVKSLKETLNEVSYLRDMAQKTSDTLQGECLFLRKESDDILKAKKKSTFELIDAQNELQTMGQRKIELEHNLRTSRFREIEAVSFLRHFRHFFRRLLHNVNAQGSGGMNTIVNRMIGAPDLNELVDLDKMMMESGLIEDAEIGNDADLQDYRPSSDALLRSSNEANKSRSEISSLNSEGRSQALQQLESIRNMIDLSLSTSDRKSESEKSSAAKQRAGSIRSAVSRSLASSNIDSGNSQTISTLTASSPAPLKASSDISPGPGYQSGRDVSHSSRSQNSRENSPPLSLTLARSPSTRLTNDKVVKLEDEVLTMTKRCIDLQMSLNSAEEMVETLSVKRKNAKIRENAKEFLAMKSELENKSADLEAVVWKMNELNLVNRSYSEKLSNRDHHIAYLEESLRSAQEKNLQLVTLHVENEKKMRYEVERLNRVIDSYTTKLWQDGAEGVPLERRILLPIQASNSLTKNGTEEIRDESPVNNENNQRAYESIRNNMKQPAPFTTKDSDPTIDAARVVIGGKTKDYIPRRFATKRGRFIRSATLRNDLSRIPVVSSSNKSSSSSEGMKTVRRQLGQLDQLSKEWTYLSKIE